jgi:hypothetical protein
MLQVPLHLGYQAEAGQDQPAQRALRSARAEVAGLLPPGYRVRVSGAAQNLPHVPWLAVLDEDVTTTAQEGLYFVYLFAESLDRAYLSMNQGVTAHFEYFKARGEKQPRVAARAELRRESDILRSALGDLAEGLELEISLGAGSLAQAYEAGSIVGCEYDVSDLPAEQTSRSDLDRFLSIYRETVDARDRLLVERPGLFNTPTRARSTAAERQKDDPDPVFRPKDASDYLANVPAQKQRRLVNTRAWFGGSATMHKAAAGRLGRTCTPEIWF